MLGKRRRRRAFDGTKASHCHAMPRMNPTAFNEAVMNFIAAH
jgi:hypothetical protein